MLRGGWARIVSFAAGAVVLVVTGAFAAASIRDTAEAPPGQQALASGALTMSNSDDGRSIFSASQLAPGGSATGTVTIRNTGSVAASLVLSPGAAESSGPRGRALLGALRLRIDDVTSAAEGDVYSGGLEELPALALDTLGPGGERSYRFSAVLPDGGASAGGAGDNFLQRATMSVAYDWTLTRVAESVAGSVGGTPPRPCRRRQIGNKRNNRLAGTRGGDRIYGKGGADSISGRGGVDCLWGGTGKDRIRGGTGDDRLHGSTGGDVLSGGAGRDRIWGGFGSDLIYARDGRNDVIDCGPGRDRVVADRGDRVRRCERVLRPARRR